MTIDARSTRSRVIARGAASLAVAQVAIAFGQIGYSAVTSRIFEADSFGRYTVGMTSTGLVLLVLTTGLPSFVLASPDLSAGSARAAVRASVLSGVLGTLILLLGAPIWSGLWQSPTATPFVRVLSLQVLFGSLGAVQLALLRREGRPSTDAAIQAGASVLGFVVGLLLILPVRNPLLLCVNPLITTAGAFVAATYLRRVRFARGEPLEWGKLWGFSRTVTLQNGIFYVLTTAPIYLVPIVATTVQLGQYSRAVLITAMPAAAITTALTRSLQPFYRHIEGMQAALGLRDASLLALSGVVPLFGLLMVLAHPLIRLVMGPGWDEAAQLTPLLAAGYGLYVVFTLLANGAEMYRRFSPVRNAQIFMLIAAFLVGSVAVITGSVFVVAGMLLAVAVVGLISLVATLTRAGVLAEGSAKTMSRQFVLSAAPVVLALVGVRLIAFPSDVAGSLAAVASALGIWAVAAFVTLRLTPSWRVLGARGLLPWRAQAR